MKNVKSILNNNDMKILSDTAEIKESCNCRNKNNCPFDGLTPNIIIPATCRRKYTKILRELSIVDKNFSFSLMVFEVRKMKLA